jgi:ribosomal protein S18 acetylase RimI-like enzyme
MGHGLLLTAARGSLFAVRKMVLIRTMSVSDIPAGLRLCRATGWNQTERDWQDFLTTAPQGALVAVEDDQVIGSVATLPYGPFAWISMVLVDPAARRRGVGTLLLNRGLALVPDGVTARLDATPAGEVLYRKLGFTGECSLARWFLDAIRKSVARPTSARPIARADWPAILDMDVRVFGASRVKLLERLAHDAPEYAWVVEAEHRLQGYVFGRHGFVREHIGPVVAESAEVAEQLLDACLRANADRAVFIDAPDDQPGWRDVLVERGFAIERPFRRMYRGRLSSPGQPSHLYAITGPEFG